MDCAMTRHHQQQQAAKGPSQRQLRVGEMIRHAFSDILLRSEIADPEFDGHAITITEVRVSPDLRNATVFCLPFGEGDPEKVRAALMKHQRFLRGELAKRVDLKYMPNLSFQIDESFDYAARIDTILGSPDVKRDLG
jgi:ribosome-binding factor A